jgi:hypothetical protein
MGRLLAPLYKMLTQNKTVRPTDLLLRCYAKKVGKDKWYAVCVDLNLDAEGSSFVDVKRSMDNAIIGYLQTVFETNSPASIPDLLRRQAPLKDRIKYYLAKRLRIASPFYEAIPVHLAHRCA